MSLEGIANHIVNGFEIICGLKNPQGAFTQVSNSASESEAECPSSTPPFPGWLMNDMLGVGYKQCFYSNINKNCLTFLRSIGSSLMLYLP